MAGFSHKNDAFTLIELMIVVTIIGVLAAIAIPKFATLIAKSHEGATKGSLGSVRSAVMIYYGDMEGAYPANLDVLTIGGKYLTQIPAVTIPALPIQGNPGHSRGNGCAIWGTSANLTNAVQLMFADGNINGQTSPYGYIDPTAGDRLGGMAFIECYHRSSAGTPWTQY